MTVTLGIKTRDGALLASDCLVKMGAQSLLKEKLRGAFYRDRNCVSGTFLTVTGSYRRSMPGEEILKGASRNPYFSHTLSPAFLAQTYETLRLGNQPGDLARMRQAAKDTTNGHSLSLLRFSNTGSSDIGVLVKDAFEVCETYFAIGSGGTHTKPVLDRRYPTCRDVHDAVELCAEALNRALEKRGEFQGYQIAFVRHTRTNPLSVMYAQSLSAERVPSKLQFKDFLV